MNPLAMPSSSASDVVAVATGAGADAADVEGLGEADPAVGRAAVDVVELVRKGLVAGVAGVGAFLAAAVGEAGVADCGRRPSCWSFFWSARNMASSADGVRPVAVGAAAAAGAFLGAAALLALGLATGARGGEGGLPERRVFILHRKVGNRR
jgi:hypothetical protein